MEAYALAKDDATFDKVIGLPQVQMEDGPDDPKAMEDLEFDSQKEEPMDETPSPANSMEDDVKS